MILERLRIQFAKLARWQKRLADWSMWAFLAAAVATSSAAGAVAQAQSISLQGSTVFNARLIEPHQATIEARAGVSLRVIPNKSIHGLVALIEGRADLAMISSALAQELDVLRHTRPDLALERLMSVEIARTRVALAVHPDNPVRTLTLAQLRAVLLGDIKRWSEVGGAAVDIIKVTVQPGGGVPSTVRNRLLGDRPFASSGLVQVEASPHVIMIVAQEPAALGITQLGLLNGARVRELVTDQAIEQQLNIVTLGPPDARQQALIEALKAVAADRLF